MSSSCCCGSFSLGDGGAGSTSSGSRGLALCDIFNCLASCRSRIEQAAVPSVLCCQSIRWQTRQKAVSTALAQCCTPAAGRWSVVRRSGNSCRWRRLPASEEASNLGTRSVVAVYLDVVNCRASLQIRGQIHFPQGLRQSSTAVRRCDSESRCSDPRW